MLRYSAEKPLHKKLLKGRQHWPPTALGNRRSIKAACPAASSNAGYWIQLAVHVFHKITVGFQLKHNGVTRLESSSTGELSLSWIPIFSFIVVNTATWLESSSKICIDSNHRAGFQSPFSSPSFGCLGSCVSLLLAPCVRA